MKKLLLAGCILFGAAAHSQNIASDADKLVSAYSAAKKFSGNILIAKKDRIVFQKSYGFASLDKQQPNEPGTSFRIGSLTKMFTAALVMQAVEEKKLSLRDPVSTFFPGFPHGDRIFIEHLLSHTSGIRGNSRWPGEPLQKMIAGYEAAEPAFAPGSSFEYNNFNYLLLAAILEKISGSSFPSLLNNHVLQPAGLYHSGLDSSGRKQAEAATGYSLNPATNDWAAITDDNIGLASGAGAMYSTTGDLFRWSRIIRKQQLLTGSSWTNMQTTRQADYGLGLILRNVEGHRSIGHTGTVRGFSASFTFFPDDDITVIFLSNFQDLDAVVFQKNLFNVALGLPYELPVQKKAMLLPREALEEYTGIYSTADSMEIKLLIADGQLVAIAPGGDRITLLAQAKDEFFMQGIDKPVNFSRTGARIDGVTINMGRAMQFKKLQP